MAPSPAAAPWWRSGAFAALLLATLGCWAVLLWSALDMTSPLARLMMPAGPAWTLGNAVAVVAMWVVMMAAMMLPSAMPMLLLQATVSRKAGTGRRSWIFAAAYLAVWAAFGAAAAAVQWGLQAAGLVSAMAASTSPALSAGLLLVAGIVQFTPLKRLCLTRCRSPLAFVMAEWRPGLAGAWIMGLRHGLYCLGCCWALMALLFATGAMNLPWVAALAVVVAIEKLAPAGNHLGRALGAALIAAGALRLVGLA